MPHRSLNLAAFTNSHAWKNTLLPVLSGLSATQNLAIEYAKDGIRFNAVAPGVVDTPMHRNDPNDSTLQPAMKKATVKDVVDAVLYLVEAGYVSGEILHVDGAAPARRW